MHSNCSTVSNQYQYYQYIYLLGILFQQNVQLRHVNTVVEHNLIGFLLRVSCNNCQPNSISLVANEVFVKA